jgi:hypothetical protein
MAIYVFDPSRKPIEPKLRKADPQVIGDALEAIAAEHEGRLNVPDVIEAATAKSHPLHPYFEWNNKIAADAWRRDQARAIIRSVRIVRDDRDDEEPPPAFVSVTDDGRAYRATTEVVSNIHLQAAVLRAAERELSAFEHRYRMLLDICALVREARAKIVARREALEAEQKENRTAA